ncbi:MAG: tRNA (adenosine(37)-N6)-threonylcarbamoyltransferase complex ATPase subunit type 1 TsaE [bacterium]|nr:tRNA (adenosine(37)-N6)-threonylcarbamoyltransferase complex ATPase subunit type 1 TsaE [bacterium]
MNGKEFITQNTKETQKLGGILAKEIVSKPSSEKAAVIGLEGELGAGKTTFIKGFAKALGIKEKILSPTFVLIKSYKIGKSAIHPLENSRATSRGSRVGGMADLPTNEYKFLVHIEAYRLKDHRGLLPLGIKEILADPQNIILIEWSDRVAKILPRKYIKIHVDHIEENIRKIRIRT